MGSQFALNAAPPNPPPMLAIMAAPPSHSPSAVDKRSPAYIAKRSQDMLARVSTQFPTNYLESREVPMTARSILLMRLDNFCPRCHVPAHINVDCANRLVCRNIISSDWPRGPYVGAIRHMKKMPSINAIEAANYMHL